MSEIGESEVAGNREETELKAHITWAQQLSGQFFCQSSVSA